MTEAAKIQKTDAQVYLESITLMGGTLTDEQRQHYRALLTAESPMVTGAGDLADAIAEAVAALQAPSPK